MMAGYWGSSESRRFGLASAAVLMLGLIAAFLVQ
jgi:hypothetical protein